jgi:two-component system C4-dicarboxylate transport sensor histidine kinase DctB
MMAAGSWASGRELRRSLAQTLELQELAELGKLTTNLLHDLVNPITAASLNLEQLHSSGDQLAIDQAMISIRYLERYVIAARNQLQQHRQPQMFEVAAEIDQVMQLLASKAQAQAVRIDLLAPSKVWLYGDQVKFNRLILNLVVNAIEAYATVSDEPISAWIHIRVDALDGKIIIVVADGAAGIAPGAIPKLFEPFFSTKRTGNNGRGIGLSIARQITVDDFGGEITVMSAAGETRFTITVPAPAVDRTSDS